MKMNIIRMKMNIYISIGFPLVKIRMSSCFYVNFFTSETCTVIRIIMNSCTIVFNQHSQTGISYSICEC